MGHKTLKLHSSKLQIIGAHDTIPIEPRCEKTGLRAVQPQKMARGLKFRIQVVEGLYYPYRENKSADQLRGTRS